ncbi:hypothetical protein JHL17_33260 [Azospirillum sp. YIM B02556]|uniref:LacI family transcriptional regulator n=1 Tax=Azospirillum endophyticum TaxID=2800326 RepID=A0ABS1FFV8_9PROT|nr:hypothetical protein [Azospirillum endophyticum]MBK1842277.1 hypothetical protein [Azospirillum endophyticum]
MSGPIRPTAIFAMNDNTAIGALSALVKLGLSVLLTSVGVPFDRIAAEALDLLSRGAASASDRIRVAQPTLIPRASTAPCRSGRR